MIICGLNSGKDGFPAPARESVIEQALLPKPEDFDHAEERRLLYVALTRAKQQVWLLITQKNRQNLSMNSSNWAFQTKETLKLYYDLLSARILWRLIEIELVSSFG